MRNCFHDNNCFQKQFKGSRARTYNLRTWKQFISCFELNLTNPRFEPKQLFPETIHDVETIRDFKAQTGNCFQKFQPYGVFHFPLIIPG